MPTAPTRVRAEALPVLLPDQFSPTLLTLDKDGRLLIFRYSLENGREFSTAEFAFHDDSYGDMVTWMH